MRSGSGNETITRGGVLLHACLNYSANFIHDFKSAYLGDAPCTRWGKIKRRATSVSVSDRVDSLQ